MLEKLLGKFNPLGQLKMWLLAIIAVLGVVAKLFYDRSERLDEKLEVANAKVDAARKFRENRRKVDAMDISDVQSDMDRLFPHKSKHPGPKP